MLLTILDDNQCQMNRFTSTVSYLPSTGHTDSLQPVNIVVMGSRHRNTDFCTVQGANVNGIVTLVTMMYSQII